MSVRLIATDLDGTLLLGDKNISPVNRRALSLCHDRGIRVAFASGRSFQSARLLARLLDFPVALLGLNGCRADETAFGPTLFEETHRRENAIALWERLKATGAYFICYCAERVFMGNPQSTEGHDVTPGPRGEAGFLQIYTPDEDEFYRDGCVKANKFVLFSRDEEKRDAARLAAQGLDVNVFSSWWDNVEIVPGGVSKGRGLARLAAHFGVDMGDVMAFGDYDNDESMLSAAGHPVAMASGSDAVKKPGRPLADSVGEYILSQMEAGKI